MTEVFFGSFYSLLLSSDFASSHYGDESLKLIAAAAAIVAERNRTVDLSSARLTFITTLAVAGGTIADLCRKRNTTAAWYRAALTDKLLFFSGKAIFGIVAAGGDGHRCCCY